MSRQVTATLALDFNFISEYWGIDFESMSDADLIDFVTDQFWEYISTTGGIEIDIEEH